MSQTQIIPKKENIENYFVINIYEKLSPCEYYYKGSILPASFYESHVFALYLVDELVLLFLVLLKEVRMLRWYKPRVTQEVVRFPSDLSWARW